MQKWTVTFYDIKPKNLMKSEMHNSNIMAGKPCESQNFLTQNEELFFFAKNHHLTWRQNSTIKTQVSLLLMYRIPNNISGF